MTKEVNTRTLKDYLVKRISELEQVGVVGEGEEPITTAREILRARANVTELQKLAKNFEVKTPPVEGI